MLRHVLAVLGALVVTHPATAQHADSQAALRQAQAYSQAYVRREADRLAEMAHPLLHALFEGRLKESWRELWAALDGQGMSIVGEELGTPSAPFVSGKTRVVGVPYFRYLKNGTKQWMNYVLTSYDGGRSWSVFDLGCTDYQWVGALASEYRGSPPLLVTSEDELATANLRPGSTWDVSRPPPFVNLAPEQRSNAKR